jgi:hypothetical protein
VELKMKKKPVTYRSWLNYSKERLCSLLEQEDWSIEDDTVQGTWNYFENKLINVVDTIIPLAKFINNSICRKSIPSSVKNKIIRRKRLLKSFKLRQSVETKANIRALDKEIRDHFNTIRIKNIRRSIVPGNTQWPWRVVKIACDVNVTTMPNQMYSNKNEVS